ncbi:alanyl-tRNA synthetase [Halogranum gelatinilyticum]|uniref:Alanyl-tRNA synthetase n=1 Tax=Halogranum gelatinilyticum TaxID=660521 RepID=A0A1G9T032_9EURY|nr:alanine--tRNA ligase-related protein [Halogranum gelatinilyticum]SDM40445.1 alanyl-tRNA synthetase [Halogranum gelatinilyticum]
MPQSLAPAEPDVREFAASVAAVDGRDVVLDSTYFYAESGGQPADRGTLAGHVVEHVGTRDGQVVHTLAEAPDVAVGETVVGVVDNDFRTYCMRAHTASHALYGAGRELLDDLGYGGFNIDSEKVRVDFETSTDIDDSVLIALERLVNRVVWDSLPVSWEEVPVAEARAREEVAFNVKTEEGVFADSDSVRIVTIGGDGSDGKDVDPFDVAACGGTHVSNTREIGPVELLGRSNPGEGLTRVEFAVGPAAIDRRASQKRATLATARELGTGVSEMPEMVRSLRDTTEELEASLADLKTEVLTTRLAALDTVERDGLTWRVGTVSGFGANDVGDAAKSVVGDGADVAVVAGQQGSTFVVVASTGDVAAVDVVDEITDEFGGGGGGGPTFAQGGGLGADPADVVASLRE